MRDAAVAVAHEFAEAHVGDDEQAGHARLQRADGALHDAVVGVGLRGALVLVRWDAEKEHAGTPAACAACGFGDEFALGELEDAGHRGDRRAGGDLFADEKREDEIARRSEVSRTRCAEGGRRAETAGTDGEVEGHEGVEHSRIPAESGITKSAQGNKAVSAA